MSEHEVGMQGGFREFNLENKKWYIENRAEIDQIKHSVHKIGEGLQIDPKDEPFFRFKKIRETITLQK